MTKILYNTVLELTLRCNARCIHCGSSAGKERSDNLTHDEWLDICQQLALLNCKQVSLIGGEVFLYPQWRDIITKLKKYGIQISIITNALLLNKENIQFLAKERLDTLGISLDGATAKTHNYIRQVPNLYEKIFALSDEIKATNINTVAVTTLNNINVYELKTFKEVLEKSFFNNWQIQIGAPYGRMKEDLSLSLLEYYVAGIFVACSQKRSKLPIFGMHDFGYFSDIIPRSVNIQHNWQGCPAGKYLLGIRSDGKVFGCLSLYDDKFICGSLKDRKLEDIWLDETCHNWNCRDKRAAELKGMCKDCDYAFMCCAGCSDVAHGYSGDIGNNPLCFHAIEKLHKDYDKDDEEGRILKILTNGHINEKGFFILENSKKITKKYIDSLKVAQKHKLLLKNLV